MSHRPQKGVEHDKHGSNRHGRSGKSDQDRQRVGNNRSSNETSSCQFGRRKQRECTLFPRQGKRQRRQPSVRSGGGERRRSSGRGAASRSDLLRDSGVSRSSGFL